MNKAELVDAIASKTNVTKKEADSILSAMTQTIVETVSGGNKVSLVGFGSIVPRQHPAREGRNPRSGEKMLITATRVPGERRWQVV